MIVESIPHMVWVAAPDGRVEYINQLGNHYTGWSAGATFDRDWLEVIHPDDAPTAAHTWRYASRSETPHTTECRIRRADGEYRWPVTRGPPLRDAAGQVAKWIGTATDNHDHKTNEAVLREAHRATAEVLTLLATLQAEAPVGFGFIDRDLCMVRINQELASMTGSPAEEQIGRPVAEVVPELWEQLEPVPRHVLATGEAIRNLSSADRPGGTESREVLASHYPARVGDAIIGIGIGIGVVVVEVTDRLQLASALKELTRAEEFRSTVMGEMAEGVFTQDGDGRLMYMNSAASRMLGWAESELRGRYMHEVLQWRTADGHPFATPLTGRCRPRLRKVARNAAEAGRSPVRTVRNRRGVLILRVVHRGGRGRRGGDLP